MSTLTIYRVAPQAESKAAKELRTAGIRAYAPTDRGGKRNPFTRSRPSTAHCYVLSASTYRPAFSKHVYGRLGTCARHEIRGLYVGRPEPVTQRPFVLGDRVVIMNGPFATLTGSVTEDRGRVLRVEVERYGRTVAAHPQHLRRIDPG